MKCWILQAIIFKWILKITSLPKLYLYMLGLKLKLFLFLK